MNRTENPEFWRSIYQAGKTGWDLGAPSPVFERLVQHRQIPPGKMIVPGAGRGHNARLFAAHGFEVTAVDFAPEALAEMRRLNTPEHPIILLEADIFGLPPHLSHTFHYVLEYLCYCAIPPSRREEYADVVTRLLKPNGFYIALAFPIGEYSGGPPYAVSIPEIIELFTARGFDLVLQECPPDSPAPRRGREELLVLWKRTPRHTSF